MYLCISPLKPLFWGLRGREGMYCMSSRLSPLFPVIPQLYLAIKAKVWKKTPLIYDYFHTNYGVTDNIILTLKL